MGDGVLSRRAFVAGLSAGIAGATQASAATAGIDPKRVARIAIHPAVGVARVGNSKDAFYFGPEVPGGVPVGPFKDEAGAMARQAARFRLFAYDAQGRVLGEVTAREAEVSWTLTVANTKALWYGIDIPFDLPGAPAAGRRNAKVADRARLAIVPGPRTVSGPGAAPQRLDGGTFQGQKVTLGEVMTDTDGRLVVMPASGRCHPAPDAPPMRTTASTGPSPVSSAQPSLSA